MNRPTECRWCGCGVLRSWGPDTIFTCLAMSHPRGEWSQSTECKLKSAEHRIQRAVELLEGATRFDVISWDGGVCRDPSDGGGEVDADIVDQVIEILKGNSPESPVSSPVTTADQLATADYYEAVRQRVPWMVTIEHIEGLVEGYRQCGVMVWKAAEQIKLIFGGVNDEAE